MAALLLASGSRLQASSQATNTAPMLPPDANAAAAAPGTVNEEALEAQTEEEELAGAAIKPISTERPLPPNIKPAGPLSEVIKLADSGLDECVIMAFVTNSTGLFDLGVEDIIYLNDIGVSGSVVTAMMQRDQALKELSAGPPAPDPGPPMSHAPQPATAPAPPEMASETPPSGDYATEGYPPPPMADMGYSTFYDSLAPYGTWVDVAGCGPCWQPTVVVANPAWRPYCDAGQWVYTDCGWYWLSGTHIHQVAITRTDRPAAGAKETATTATGSMRTVAPLILHGPDRPGQGTTGSGAAVREAYPPNALVFIGSKEANLRKTARQSSTWTTETPRFRTTAASQEVFEHPVANQKPQPVTTAEWARPVRSELPTRSEHQWQYAAPSYQAQAPAELRWSPPAPTAAPQEVRSYSAPTVSSTPRAQPTESRPSYSAPASHTQSSWDKKGR